MMVAYSCKKRFAPAIAAYFKRHTIRGNRKRHARVGEDIQLYVGMRTKFCTKIIPDPVCTRVEPVRIEFTPKETIARIWVADVEVSDLDAFAIEDGFECAEDMARFWFAEHQKSKIDAPLTTFNGFLIGWEPKANAERIAA